MSPKLPIPTPTLDRKDIDQNLRECWELIRLGREKKKQEKNRKLFGNQ